MYEITRMDNIHFLIYVKDPMVSTYEYPVYLFYAGEHDGGREWDRNPEHVSVEGCERLDGSGESQIYVKLTDDFGNEWVRVFMPNGGSNSVYEIF